MYLPRFCIVLGIRWCLLMLADIRQNIHGVTNMHWCPEKVRKQTDLNDDHLKELLVHLLWCKSKEMNFARIAVIFCSTLTHPENWRHIFFLKASIHLNYSVFQPLVNSSSLLCRGAWRGNFLILILFLLRIIIYPILIKTRPFNCSNKIATQSSNLVGVYQRSSFN